MLHKKLEWSCFLWSGVQQLCLFGHFFVEWSASTQALTLAIFLLINIIVKYKLRYETQPIITMKIDERHKKPLKAVGPRSSLRGEMGELGNLKTLTYGSN